MKLSIYFRIPYRQLLDQLSYDDLLDYIAFNNINNFAEDKISYQIAGLTRLFYNTICNPEDRKSIEDFLPYPVDQQQQSPDEIYKSLFLIGGSYRQ
jgi:hypothetical protein